MNIRKKVRKDKEKVRTFFVDENDIRQSKEIVVYKNKDEIIEIEYLDGNKHGYSFVKNKNGEIIKEERWWHGYFCDDKEHFKKLMTDFRLEMIDKKYEF